MRPSPLTPVTTAPINIERSARRVNVDNRISLRNYYRIADSLIRQANIYHNERNIIDLYVMLLRFSSLVTETIPFHQDYRLSSQAERNYFRGKLLEALDELERLKPEVRQRLSELSRKSLNQGNELGQVQQNGSVNPYRWPVVRSQITRNTEPVSLQVDHRKDIQPVIKPNDDQFPRPIFNIPRPKEETLSKHSILGPNGLQRPWQPPIVAQPIQYPSKMDFTPIDIQSLLDPTEDKPSELKATEDKMGNGDGQPERTPLEEVLSLQDSSSSASNESSSTSNLDIIESLSKLVISRDPSPPPVRAEVQDVVAAASHVSDPFAGQAAELQDQLVKAQAPQEVHISTKLMDTFMRLAKSNTDKNLETCGVLAGSLKNRKFYVTAIIVPKQQSTSSTCQTTNEEEVFDYQDKNSLFSLGWIHTHPTQSCFMSSVDIHTQYSYQVMLPEAIAIVMAPRDSSRKHGIFRLTVPGGMTVVKNCPHSGFHPHPSPSDGSPIYRSCTDVYMSPNLPVEVADLR